MPNEVALWDTLKGLLPRGQYSRIESPDTAPGFPDVQYQLPDVAGTIELKDSKHKTGIPFRNEEEGLHLSQQVWIKENVANGGICWIVARYCGDLYWIQGDQANEFNRCPDLHTIATSVVNLKKVTSYDLKRINLMLRRPLAGFFL